VAEIIVRRLRECGIHDIVMALGYGADLIRAFFQDGSHFGVRIGYYVEPHRMGTAGSLAHIPELANEHFLLTNGDLVTDLDYSAFLKNHIESGAPLSVGVRHEEIAIPYGVLNLKEKDVLSVEEKPAHRYCFNAGIYGVSPEALQLIPRDHASDMTDLISALIAAGRRVRAEEIGGFWFDLAKAADFERAVEELERKHPKLLDLDERP
jgi:NDP-sugar pyrophosphorylase family protein